VIAKNLRSDKFSPYAKSPPPFDSLLVFPYHGIAGSLGGKRAAYLSEWLAYAFSLSPEHGWRPVRYDFGLALGLTVFATALYLKGFRAEATNPRRLLICFISGSFLIAFLTGIVRSTVIYSSGLFFFSLVFMVSKSSWRRKGFCF